MYRQNVIQMSSPSIQVFNVLVPPGADFILFPLKVSEKNLTPSHIYLELCFFLTDYSSCCLSLLPCLSHSLSLANDNDNKNNNNNNNNSNNNDNNMDSALG